MFDNEAIHNYKIITKANYAGLLIHVLWVALFIWLNIPILIFANVIGCLVYLCCFFLARKKTYYIQFFIVHTTIPIQVVLGTIMLGWEAGIHYYIILTLYAAFFFRSIHFGFKLFIVFANIVIYLLLYYLIGPPKVFVNEQLVQLLHGINIVIVFGLIALLSAFYRNSVDQMLAELHDLIKNSY